MYSKRRIIPLNVSVWMEKDVTVRKASDSSGLMPDNTRYNVFLSRQFYSDMLSLSEKRHRKLVQFDYDKKQFLKNQRQKAETTMPGLLPYIKKFKDELDDEPVTHVSDLFSSPTLQSMTTRSIIKSESTFSVKKPSKRRNKRPNRPEASLERLNQLSQPKGRQYNPSSKDHLRSNLPKIIRSEDLFENLNNISYMNSFLPKTLETNTTDKRFQQLVHLFSEVHESELPKIQSVKTIVESNASLQYDYERWGPKNVPTIEDINQDEIMSEYSNSKTDVYLIEPCV